MLLALLLAGVVYDCTTEMVAARSRTVQHARVLAQGDSYRVELPPDPSRQIDLILSRDRGRTEKIVDLDSHSWSNQITLGPRRSSTLFHISSDDRLDGRPLITHRTAGTISHLGREVTRHIVELDYALVTRAYGSNVRARVHANVELWIADDLPDLPMRTNVITGHATIDKEIVRTMAAIHGLIVKNELVVTRWYEGGPPQQESTTSVIDSLEVTDIPDSKFEVPRDFTYVAPRK